MNERLLHYKIRYFYIRVIAFFINGIISSKYPGMKQFGFIFFGGVLTVLIVSACSKKATLPVLPKPITKTDMLVYSRWKLVAQGFDTNNDGTIDLDETPAYSCVLDNLIFFYKTGNGSFDQGPTKCDPDHAQSRRFEWAFTNNESMIIIDAQEYKILFLTENDFVVTYEDIFTPAPNNYILKLTH
jgi:hypothetical protein